jgi:histidinol dehydrogenase
MRILEWTSMPEAERRAVLARPAQRDAARIAREAEQIIEAVRAGGDAALRDLTQRFDGVRLTDLAQILARLEGLDGCAAAVGIRLAALAETRA